ncbi:MAG: type III-B CRISPR module RAMP protein Cmr6 [Thermoplasmata archaeon]
MNNNIPIYKEALSSIPPFQPDKTNAGLWYNKFFGIELDKDEQTKDKDTEDNYKTKKIKEFSNKPIGSDELIKELVSRQKEIIKSMHGHYMLFKNTSKFLTGVGNSHPTEIGFTWHHTLGVPYLPGSSIKGLVRSYCENQNINKEDIKRIFGSMNKNNEDDVQKENNENSVGSVIFLDALPYKHVKLAGDIMTPHYNDYYQNAETPGDWIMPIPIPFLVVEKDQEFLFGIIPRSPKTDKNDIDLAKEWLEKALKTLGAGAKTSVGYGIFELTEEVTEGDLWLKKLEEYKKLGLNDKVDIPNITQIVQEWEKESDPELKRSIAEAIKKRINVIYTGPNYWNNPLGGKIKKAIEKLKNTLGE